MSGAKDSSESPVHIDVLPYEILLKIFSYLTIDELVSVQFVCKQWQNISRDDVLWKDYVFNCDLPAEEFSSKLRIMPTVKNIRGRTVNGFVDVILQNVVSLRKLHCRFIPCLSVTQMERLIDRYPELESISLDNCSSAFCDHVKLLTKCKNLKQVLFVPHSKHYPILLDRSKAVAMLRFLNKNENFPVLENLNLTSSVFGSNLLKGELKNVIPDIITNRSHQLTSLSIEMNNETEMKISEAISRCENLCKINLSLSLDRFPSINFYKLSKLKSLYIQLVVRRRDIFIYQSIYEPLSSSSWRNLNEFVIYVLYMNDIHTLSQLNILEVAIRNMRELRKLSYTESKYFISECQLQHVGHLSKLEYLSVHYINNLSELCLKSLSNCLNLKMLDLSFRTSDIQNLDIHVVNMIYPMRKLKYLRLYVNSDSYTLCYESREKIVEFINQFVMHVTASN